MKLHRFYTPNTKLAHNFWLNDKELLHQWARVLRFVPGREVVLFDGLTHDRLYKITEIDSSGAHLEYITDFERVLPGREIYLMWSLLKKDKNDWVLQKCTELGVSHFLPILADRSEKTGFNIERAKRIVIEAAEQCGRSDIPTVREPMLVETAINQLSNKMSIYICEIDGHNSATNEEQAAVLIGPEGGWSDAEKELFKARQLPHLNLHDFTLRAETAATAAAVKLLQ